jgi:uncharacterized tellurite resistance protein B-like protein
VIHLFKHYFEKKENTMSLSSEKKEERLRVALCALLLEVAYCDDEFSDQEKTRIIEAMKSKFSLDDAEAQALIELAEQERERSVDLWHFTNLINQNYSPDDKLEVITLLWKIVYADSVLEKHEDYLIHKLAMLLRLDHKQLIAAKLKAMPS